MTTDLHKIFILALTAAIFYLIYLLQPVLTPFFIAALLAYMGDPLVDRLEKLRMPRTLAVVVVFVGLFLLLSVLVLLVVPALEQQIVSLISSVPRYIEWFQVTVLPRIQERFQFTQTFFDFERIQQAFQEHWQKVGGFAATIVGSVSRSGIAIIGVLVNLVLIPVVTFYLLRDWDFMIAKLQNLLPRHIEPTVSRLAVESNEMVGAFLRGQLLVMLGLATIYSLGLWMIGLDFAFLIGILSGLVSFVPYLGFIIGITIAGVVAAVQFQDVMHVLMVGGVFTVGQMAESMLLTPLLVGDRIGLHPVMVIFAVMAGGQLFGFLGILLALPAAAVFMVLLREAHQRYLKSKVYIGAK